jgi:hypothetical protein
MYIKHADNCGRTSTTQELALYYAVQWEVSYIAAKARMLTTSTFVFRFILRSQTIKIGSVPNAQSAKALTAERE